MIDKQCVGITERDEYLAVALDPGIHHLCVASLKPKGLRDGLLRIVVEANVTYYVKQDLDSKGTTWHWYENPRLTLLDEDQGAAAMARVKPVHH